MQRLDSLRGYQSSHRKSQKPLSGTEIRLIYLLPKRLSPRAVKCRLSITTLDNHPQYEALSYCWGDPKRKKRIFCDGKWIYVSANLHEALFYLRPYTRQRILWVDAICIDQRSTEEKNHQIRLMGRIYGEASRVVAYIGSVICVEKKTKRRALRFEKASQFWLSYSQNKPSVPDEVREATIEFFGCTPWFERAWIIQEAATARSVYFKSGEHVLHWRQVVDVAGAILQSRKMPLFIASICRHILFIQRCQIQDERPSLAFLLCNSTRCIASDPRDKVYAVYSLAADQALLPAPDYNKTPDLVFQDTVWHLLEANTSLDWITCAGISNDYTFPFENPSWIPRWKGNENADLLSLNSDTILSLTETYRFKIGRDGKQLKLQGVIIDEIEGISWSHMTFSAFKKSSLTSSKQTNRCRYVQTSKSLFSQSDFDAISALRPISRGVTGLLALTNSRSQKGDKLARFVGANLAYVLRHEGPSYRLVGEAILPDMFHSVSGRSFRNQGWRWITLV